MKMLVALDESPFAEAVLPTASALAASTGAEVVLATVVKSRAQRGTPLAPPSLPPDFQGRVDISGGLLPNVAIPTQDLAETRVQAEQRVKTGATEYLEAIARRWFPRGAEPAILDGNNVAEELGGYARDHDVDLIAMATHGRTGLAKVLMGSVASALLRPGATPVVLIRPGRAGKGHSANA